MSEHADAPLMLSVSGARGIVGKTMTPEVAARFARAFGSMVREHGTPPLRGGDGGTSTLCVDRPLLVLGRDSRPSGAELAAAAAEALASVGCDVVDLDVVMTPTAGVMISNLGAAGGMIITASHNPIQWNGIKCLNHHGVAPPPDQAAKIIERFTQGDQGGAAVAENGRIASRDDATDLHIGRVLAAIDPAPIRAKRFKVVLDSVNGAGSIGGRALLEQLGCEVVHLNGEPTGQFAHTPEPTKENLTDLCDAVREHGADVGFAQDPDADRLAVVDEQGTYIGEEYTLVLAAKRVLDRDGGGVLAANLSTSRMIDDLAAKYPGTAVLRTAVGEANVAAAMMGADNLRIGGEGNGGVIYPPVTWVRDSLSAMALVLGVMASDDCALSQIVGGLPHYVMIKRKFDLAEMGGRDAIPGLLAKVNQQFAGERINDADGVRIDFDDGWVHLRPSNTEPIVRLIVEGTSDSGVEAILSQVQLESRGGESAAC